MNRLDTLGFVLAAAAFILMNVALMPHHRVAGFVSFYMACALFGVVRVMRWREKKSKTQRHGDLESNPHPKG